MSFGIMDILDPGDLFGTKSDSNTHAANAALQDAYKKAEETGRENRSLYSQYLNKVNSNYGKQANQFNNRVKDLENMEAYDAGQFGYGKSVDDFYSKFANQRKQAATDAITNSMANAGNMFSSDYTDALAAKQQALASEEWDKAYDKYSKDRSQALQEFTTNANLGQQAYQNQYNQNKDLLGLSQNALDNTTNAYAAYTQGLANTNNMLAQNYAQMAQGVAANNISNNKSLIGRIFG